MLISRICVTLLQSFSFTFYQLLPILIFQNLYSNSKSYLNSKPFSKLILLSQTSFNAVCLVILMKRSFFLNQYLS